MKVVSPYRPFPPESAAHLRLGAFDWIAALRMLCESVRVSCGCQTYALTDVDTTLPVPMHAYVTRERRLMLWILEVSLRYLQSSDFNEDTVMVSPDMLVFHPLAPHFTADLGILVRTGKFSGKRPVLNSVQWWAYAAKERLTLWYAAALAYARRLPDNVIVWGADTEPFVRLLAPLERGAVATRGSLSVAFLPCEDIVEAFRTRDALSTPMLPPTRAVVDFRYARKQFLRQYFDATIGLAVRA